MSATGFITPSVVAEPSCAEPGGPIVRRLAQWADRLNPILVKEARQALKSRQFLATFSLVLLCAWGWSLIGVALLGPTMRYTAQGHTIFLGYFFILGAALWVIIPFSAFRSLAQERDDRTMELLTITNLTPRQIVAGKLATALLQMIVYLSALAPCLAFTYLLRGIDVVTILLLTGYAVIGCVLLSLVGLVLAATVRGRTGQVALSLVFVAGLVWLFVFAIGLTVAGAMELRPEDESFWTVQFALAALMTGYGAVLFLAAAARLTGSAGNRSTALRWALVAVQGLLAGVFGGAANASGQTFDPDFLAAFSVFSALHWYAAGVFLVSEPHISSARLRRALPQSGLARLTLTWFNPGPGTGYAFVLLGALATCGLGSFVALMPDVWWQRLGSGFPSASNRNMLHCLAWVQLGYLAFYLGVGKAIVSFIRRRRHVNDLATAAIHLALVFLGGIIPYAVQQASQDLRGTGYSALQASNVMWTLLEFLDRSYVSDQWIVATVVVFAGLAVAAGHLPGLWRELDVNYAEPPRRVVEEDTALSAALAPPPAKQSPWDD